MKEKELRDVAVELHNMQKNVARLIGQIESTLETIDDGRNAPRHMILLKKISSQPSGATLSEVRQLAHEAGYGDNLRIGVFFKGRKPSLTKVEFPSGEEKYFVTKRALQEIRN